MSDKDNPPPSFVSVFVKNTVVLLPSSLPCQVSRLPQFDEVWNLSDKIICTARGANIVFFEQSKCFKQESSELINYWF